MSETSGYLSKMSGQSLGYSGLNSKVLLDFLWFKYENSNMTKAAIHQQVLVLGKFIDALTLISLEDTEMKMTLLST